VALQVEKKRKYRKLLYFCTGTSTTGGSVERASDGKKIF
jgi:hypothetical protein